jgi:hypothetical protein
MAPVDPPPASSDELVQELADAYRTMDHARFAATLAADFIFILDEPSHDGESRWDADTELRIHSRMFDPDRIPAGEPPLAPENWLQSVSIALTPESAFAERSDLYTTANPPGPLDPARWIARSTTFGYSVFFQLQGETDYQTTGRSRFTVIEDRSMPAGAAGKFQIYRWDDWGPSGQLHKEEKSWSAVKELFN